MANHILATHTSSKILMNSRVGCSIQFPKLPYLQLHRNAQAKGCLRYKFNHGQIEGGTSAGERQQHHHEKERNGGTPCGNANVEAERLLVDHTLFLINHHAV
jgi:hypothetical protein